MTGRMSGLVFGQAPPGVKRSGREAVGLGRLHHQQGARPEPPHHLGHGLRLLPLRIRHRLRGAGQQAHRVPPHHGGGPPGRVLPYSVISREYVVFFIHL